MTTTTTELERIVILVDDADAGLLARYTVAQVRPTATLRPDGPVPGPRALDVDLAELGSIIDDLNLAAEEELEGGYLGGASPEAVAQAQADREAAITAGLLAGRLLDALEELAR